MDLAKLKKHIFEHHKHLKFISDLLNISFSSNYEIVDRTDYLWYIENFGEDDCEDLRILQKNPHIKNMDYLVGSIVQMKEFMGLTYVYCYDDEANFNFISIFDSSKYLKN